MTEEAPIVNQEGDNLSLEERLKNLRGFFFQRYQIEKSEENSKTAHFVDPVAPKIFDETDLGETELRLWEDYLDCRDNHCPEEEFISRTGKFKVYQTREGNERKSLARSGFASYLASHWMGVLNKKR
ncbi:MAG: hypothetical protein WC531_01410 [Candidatus Paceibacterota bacterium]|jgi:hypothetical protein